jgi:hypothetical protein
MQEGTEVGAVRWSQSGGAAWVFRRDHVGQDRLTAGEDALAAATVAAGAPVMMGGGAVGRCASLSYSERDGMLVLFYTTPGGPPQIPPARVVCAAHVQPQGLICPTCRRHFDTGAAACECIFHAPTLIIPKIHVTGVTFYDVMHEDVTAVDSRAGLLTAHFTGAMSSLQFLDPL